MTHPQPPDDALDVRPGDTMPGGAVGRSAGTGDRQVGAADAGEVAGGAAAVGGVPMVAGADAPHGGDPVAPRGGEAIPAQRRLARPPSDRFRTPAPPPIKDHPDLGRATLLGLAGALAYVVPAALLLAVLSITAGLVAVAVLGGWLIGVGVRTGAWRGLAHRPSKAPLALAAVLGAVAWLGGLVLAWIVSMAILPLSSRTFLERIVATPFPEWIAPQLAPLDYLVLTMLVVVAWVTAHTTGLEREAARRSSE
jgi:uncharacterized membrane protein